LVFRVSLVNVVDVAADSTPPQLVPYFHLFPPLFEIKFNIEPALEGEMDKVERKVKVEVLKPKAPIRRFDIFAEWNRIKALKEFGFSPDDAKAYGLAVAKVVAARKFYGHRLKYRGATRAFVEGKTKEKWWEKLASAREFDEKIVDRMGRDFYERVFSPAILKAYQEGKSYEEIRDALRQEWNALLEG
jgi:hypothetical protein